MDRESGEEAFETCVLDSLFNSRDVLTRNRTAEDLVDEFEHAPARERFHGDLAIGELAVSA